jgi:hypothetical protein
MKKIFLGWVYAMDRMVESKDRIHNPENRGRRQRMQSI